VTHELRTPLTNIRAYTETLSSGMFEDPKVITECYNVITKETRRLSRLVEDMLSVSQLEVGSIELHVDNVDLKALLGDGVRDVRGLADEKNIDIQLVLPAKLESQWPVGPLSAAPPSGGGRGGRDSQTSRPRREGPVADSKPVTGAGTGFNSRPMGRAVGIRRRRMRRFGEIG
jgi:signal transduction histidine kinase